MNLKTTEHKRRLLEIVRKTSVSFAIDDFDIMKNAARVGPETTRI